MNKARKTRTKKNTKLFIAVTSLGIALIVGFFIYASQERCRLLSCLSFPLTNNRKPTEIYENTPDAFRGSYTTSEGLIRVSKYANVKSPEGSANLTKTTMMRLEGLFADAKSPYPGPLSDEISCDNKYKPQPKTIVAGTNTMTYFYGYLNNRLQYGTCIDNQITHIGYNALLYCSGHSSWYQVEVIVPKKEVKTDEFYINLLSTLHCSRPLSFL